MAGTNTCGLLRLKSIGMSRAGGRKPCTLLQAARHNLREVQDEWGGRAHINSGRTRDNVVTTGPADSMGVVLLARERMSRTGVDVSKLRRDYVQAIELLFSLPVASGLDEAGYFLACQEWVAQRFKPENMLSGVIHRDESAPHFHVLVLPLMEGKMVGGDLKRFRAMADLRSSFFSEVAERFGLSRGSGRMTGAQRRMATDAVLARMNASCDPCTRSPVWQVIRDTIEANPEPYVVALGLSLGQPSKANKPLRTMAQIFTSPGKGAKRETGRPN